MIELLYSSLSLEKCVESVRRPGSGGVVTFVGSVRDMSEGNKVTFLEYEAYEPMAIEKIQQVIDEAMNQWPVNEIAIQHRLGSLQIGEDAVIIAVSCPHRGEAFAACHYLIDRLKEIVPIWKKEHGEHGEVWVGGPSLDVSPPTPDPGPD